MLNTFAKALAVLMSGFLALAFLSGCAVAVAPPSFSPNATPQPLSQNSWVWNNKLPDTPLVNSFPLGDTFYVTQNGDVIHTGPGRVMWNEAVVSGTDIPEGHYILSAQNWLIPIPDNSEENSRAGLFNESIVLDPNRATYID